ncbi:uncharacterized protein H6S33_008415 [Morchella sextelata]|uniref:uncharacterized protein n=1 Tax=Morchella sextelata TaxID=1174677 RepID=UPI001D03C17D|nr:uncharacterized protein H6S33_008415 [Morchella sextelata]KAH0602765.1 hypothetical protein H6S33_008415 [Morchella sextelata]
MLPASSQQQQPAQPVYVLRGHSAQIHAVVFTRDNERIITADADGWVVVWNVGTRRPVAVWKAHEGTVMNVVGWDGKIITHGRDNKILVWKLGTLEDESGMDTALPVDLSAGHRRSPWLLCALDVNALNFCGFAMCEDRADSNTPETWAKNLLIAIPSALNSDSVDIMRLPTKERVHAGIRTEEVKTGMAMSLGLFYCGNTLTLVAAYESGHAAVYKFNEGLWSNIYLNKSHSQPILSLCVSPFPEAAPYFLTSSADAAIVKHPLNPLTPNSDPIKTVNTKHSGQQSISIRSDGKLFATAGWDSRIRVYSTKTMKELAVLKWHQEGCYSVAFGEVLEPDQSKETDALITVEERRREKVRAVHWVAGGAKDGKVSLWEVY